MSEATLTIQGVEQLLALRDGYNFEDDCPSLEQIAAALENAMSVEDALTQVPHAEDCQLCEEAIRLYLSIDDSGIMAPAPVLPFYRKSRRVVNILLAAAVLVFGLTVVVWNQIFSEPKSTLTAKGMTYDFQIAVSRGDAQFPLYPGHEVKTGDNLGFFYTAPQDGYLAVFFVDANGEVALLYPSRGRTTAAIKQGVSLPVPDGAVVTPATHREWIVAVFYPEKQSLEEVKKEILSTMRIDQGGRLRVAPTGAVRTTVQQIRERGSK